MISQIELISAICFDLDRQGVKSLVSRQYNAVIAAANYIIAEIGREPVLATEGMGLAAWLASDDVGLSSRYMAGVLGGSFTAEYAHPYDPGDFGRCVRLLDAVPEFRDRLAIMAGCSDVWKRLVAVWVLAEDAYRTGRSKDCCELVKATYSVTE